MPHRVVAGIKVDDLGGEVEGADAALAGEVEGAEVVHDLAELVPVGDGHHGVGPVVLRHGDHVRQLRPPAGWQPLVGGTLRRRRRRRHRSDSAETAAAARRAAWRWPRVVVEKTASGGRRRRIGSAMTLIQPLVASSTVGW